MSKVDPSLRPGASALAPHRRAVLQRSCNLRFGPAAAKATETAMGDDYVIDYLSKLSVYSKWFKMNFIQPRECNDKYNKLIVASTESNVYGMWQLSMPSRNIVRTSPLSAPCNDQPWRHHASKSPLQGSPSLPAESHLLTAGSWTALAYQQFEPSSINNHDSSPTLTSRNHVKVN